MAIDETPGDTTGPPGDTEERRKADLLWSYLDRLNAGERIDTASIRRENPDLAGELISQIDAFREIGFENAEGIRSRSLGTLGDYALRRQVGRGGMGVVYEAWENSMERRVALKVLPAGIAADEKAFHRFMREARAAGRLNHPNVVPVYSMGVKERTPYYAMEFVDGETLAQALKRETATAAAVVSRPPFGPRTDARFWINVAEAFAGAAEGLQHAHSKGVVHRDLKPSNLILDPRGCLRILDFGLARLEGQESLTHTGDFLGTVLYMSPEQAMARRVPVDHRTDIYSLGATLYETLGGGPPFEGKSYQDTLSQIMVRDPAPLRSRDPRVPKDLETITLKCLQKDPADRYRTAEALAQDLRRFVRGDPIEARPQTVWERATRRMVRNRGRLAAAAAILVLLVTAGFLVWKDLRERRLKREAEYEPRVMDAVMRVSARPLSKQWKDGLMFGVLPVGLEEATGAGSSNHIADAIRELESTAPLVPERPDADYHRARWLLLLEDDDGAEKAVRSALSCSPGFAPGRALLARILEKRGESGAGREELDRTSGSSQSAWAQAWIAAHRAVDEFRWEEAEASFGTLIEIELSGRPPYAGSMMESLVGRGRARLEAEKYPQAIEDFARAEHLWPGWPVPILFKAKAYARLGNLDHAEMTIETLWGRFDHKDEIAYQAIQLFKQVGAFDRSYRWTDRLSTPYLRACFQAHLGEFLNRWEEGLAAAREAIRLNPGDVFARLQVGFLAFNRLSGPQLDFPEQCCREAVALAPALGLCHYRLALLLFKRGRIEAALAECEKGIQAEPNSPWSYEAKGWILTSTGSYPEAASALERAVELEPLLQGTRRALALAFLKASRFEEAINTAKESVRISPGYDDLWWALALCLEKAGRIDEAIEAYRTSSRKQPQALFTSRSFSGLVRLLIGKGLIQEALSEAKAAIEVHPAHENVNLLLRGLLRDEKLDGLQGEFLAIVYLLEKAALSGNESPAIQKTLAEAWNRGHPLPDPEKALRYATRAYGTADASDVEAPLILAEVQFAHGLVRDAVLTLEATLERKGSKALRLTPVSLLDFYDPLESEYSNEPLVEKLGKYRKALLPDFASYASIDAEVTDLERARSALLEFMSFTGDDTNTRKLLYLEGRVLQLEGRWLEASDRFERLSSDDPERLEPLLRCVESLRAAGDFAGAEAKVCGQLMSKDPVDTAALYELWAKIALSDQRKDPAYLVDAVPRTDDIAGADLRWLLTELTWGRPIRINCGDGDPVDENLSGWSRDRFFTGGRRSREWRDGKGGTEVHPFEGEVLGADDPVPYLMYRSFPPDGCLKPGYRIPLPPGEYTIRLHFAETYFRGPDMRIFDVSVEGRRILQSYEAFDAGFATSRVETCQVQVEDELLEIEFIRMVANPFISAIEIERRR